MSFPKSWAHCSEQNCMEYPIQTKSLSQEKDYSVGCSGCEHTSRVIPQMWTAHFGLKVKLSHLATCSECDVHTPLGIFRGEFARDWVVLDFCSHWRLKSPFLYPLLFDITSTLVLFLWLQDQSINQTWEMIFFWRSLNHKSLYKVLFISHHTEFNLGEACRLKIKHFILYIFIIFAMFCFSEHGKQAF